MKQRDAGWKVFTVRVHIMMSPQDMENYKTIMGKELNARELRIRLQELWGYERLSLENDAKDIREKL